MVQAMNTPNLTEHLLEQDYGGGDSASLDEESSTANASIYRKRPPTEAALLLFVMQKGFQQVLHLRRLDRVWPIAVDALICAWAFVAGRQHQLCRLPALRTNALIYRHRDNPAKATSS